MQTVDLSLLCLRSSVLSQKFWKVRRNISSEPTMIFLKMGGKKASCDHCLFLLSPSLFRMKFAGLFLMLSMVVFMAEPGECIFHHIIRGAFDGKEFNFLLI